MPQSQLSLPPSEFARAFPFHLALDHALNVVQVGAALQRVYPTLEPGVPFAAHFRVLRPRAVATFAAMRQHANALFLVKSLATPLTLKGQMLAIPDLELLVFLGSPWVTGLEQLQTLGVSLSDFAVHDPVADYLILLRTQRTALSDMERLATQLAEQQTRLIATNDSVSVETRRLAETQSQLRDSEQRYRSVVDNVKEVIFQTDAAGKWTFLNRVWTELTGFGVAESLGTDFVGYVHPDDRAQRGAVSAADRAQQS